MKKIFILLLFVFVYNANSQSLIIFDVDTTDFPTMRAKFYAFDEDGKQITNLSTSDFELTENGEVRTITDISCPIPQPPKALSSVLVIDISGSMIGKNIVNAKEAAKSWINALPDESECAITSFNLYNYLNHDFTKNKSKLLNEVDKLSPQGGTDFNYALLEKMAGGLQISKRGKNKKVIIFLTDGFSENTKVEEIINESKNQNCIIYCVTLGIPAPSILKDIAIRTGGMWFENITTIEDAKKVYNTLILISQEYLPCNITWQSKRNCKIENRNIELFYNLNNTYSKDNYVLPILSLQKLDFMPEYVRFQDPLIGTTLNEKITLTAINSSFNVSNIIPSDPSFSLTPTNFTLDKNESIDLTLSYTALDSSNIFCKFEIINDICNQYCYASGGYDGRKPKNPTLKITHPNGGEKFEIGIDTIISWEGVLPSDKVRLEYSIDNGLNWKILTNNATGLKYKWSSVPNLKSENCLLKISQGDFDENFIENNPSPFIQWEKTFGGSRLDHIYSSIETQDGGLIFLGYTDSKGRGKYDVWAFKVNQKDGSIIWDKTFGSRDTDYGFSVIESKKGEIYIAATTSLSDGDVTDIIYGHRDIWILKLNSIDGSLIWQKSYGSLPSETANCIIETNDGSLILLGHTVSNTINQDYDIYVLKINPSDGSILWEKTIGGSNMDRGNCIIETSDGSLVLSGGTGSKDGDITDKFDDSFDFIITKLDNKNGTTLWQKTYGGTGADESESIIEMNDGTLVALGDTGSKDKDVKENKGGKDFWIIKLNPLDGSLIRQKTIGGSEEESFYSATKDNNGDILLAGFSKSIDGDVSENKGETDYWIVKLNSINDSIIWQKTLGGSRIDAAHTILHLKDDSYIVGGRIRSNDGDISVGKSGFQSAWIIKLKEPVILQNDISDNVFSIVAPEATAIDIDMGKCLVDNSKDSVVNEFIQNIGSWKFRVDSIYFQGADAGAFSLVSGFPEYTIEANNSHFAEFRFAPQRVGVHNAEIVVITQSDTFTQNITGEGIDRNIAVIENFIDFGQVYLGDFKDTLQEITIKNVGATPFTIIETKHNYPNDVDFTTLIGGGNFTLQPNETRPMELRFTPSDIGRTSGMLEFHYDGVGSPAVIQLFGEGIERIAANIKIKTLEFEAYAGDEIEVPIIISEKEFLDISGVESITANLIFNPTLLLPIGYDIISIDYNTAYIEINDIPVNDEMKTVKFKAGLGNAVECDLIISNPLAIGGEADIAIEDGKFTLLGVCYEGGARLLDPNSVPVILSINPNPTGNTINIEFELIEKGGGELMIVDYEGKKVFSTLLTDTPGKVNLELNSSGLPNGIYNVILQTPTINATQKLLIEK